MSPRPFVPLSDLVSLKGKRAVITGAAMGIGFAISRRLAEAGASVVIADINKEEAGKAAGCLKEMGYKPVVVECDVSSEEDIKNLFSRTAAEIGGVDILVNNAGIFPQIPLEKMTSSDFERIIAVNLKSMFLCIRETSRIMIEQKTGGCIINLASIDAVHPSTKGFSAYDASKGGVLTMTKSLAAELGRHYIRVNAIAPGAIMTEGARSRTTPDAVGSGRSLLKELMSRMALGRLGDADDIARVALFLASDMASYITGTCIFVDGGYLIS
jgi:2-dehydro-3-deoxy-D-gluconate 5-dehydrogenase